MWTTSWFILFYAVHLCYTCQPGTDTYIPGSSGEDRDKPLAPPIYIYGQGDNPNYWKAPSGLTVQDFKNKHKYELMLIKQYEAQMSSSEKRRPSDADEDWPDGWTNLGFPFKGNAPPDHAKIKNSAGKAGMCYEPPLIGHCARYVYRYGFNPYTSRCERYTYSGCGGNLNNFLTMRRCTEVCATPTKSTCVGDTNDKTKLHDYMAWHDVPSIYRRPPYI